MTSWLLLVVALVSQPETLILGGPDVAGATAEHHDISALPPLERVLPNGLNVKNVPIGHVLAIVSAQAQTSLQFVGNPGEVSLRLPAGSTVASVLAALERAGGYKFTVGPEGAILVMDRITFETSGATESAPAPTGEATAEAVPGEPPPQPTPGDMLDRPLPDDLRLMNVSLTEAAQQLATLAGIQITVCDGFDAVLRTSVGQGKSVRQALDSIARFARGEWFVRGEGAVELCRRQSTGARQGNTPVEYEATFTVDETRLHVRGRELFYQGRPVKLVGVSYPLLAGDTNVNLAEWLDLLALRGINLTRVFLVPSWKATLFPFVQEKGVFDLARYDDAFFLRLEELLRLADERGIVVQLVLVEPLQWKSGAEDRGRQNSPLVRKNNTDLIDGTYDAGCEWFRTEGKAAERLLALMARTLRSTTLYPNVIYELCNEPPPGTERWHVWFAEQLRPLLNVAQGSQLLSMDWRPELDPTVLEEAAIDLWSVAASRATVAPATSEKPCIVGNHGTVVDGDIRAWVDGALGTPNGHFLYQDHLLPYQRYWERQPDNSGPLSLALPRVAQPGVPAWQFAERLGQLGERCRYYARNVAYSPSAPVPRDVPSASNRLIYYGELGAGAQVMSTAEYSTLAEVDLDVLPADKASKAVQLLRDKGVLVLFSAGGETGLAKVRETLDGLYRDGRRDAVANVWAVRLERTPYSTPATAPNLYGADPELMRLEGLVQQFRSLVRDAETPWGERPYAHIRSMLIVGHSTDAEPAWGPWALGTNGEPVNGPPTRLLPAGVDVLGLELPLSLSGLEEQTNRLQAAVRAGYPVLRDSGLPRYPRGRAPALLLVGAPPAEGKTLDEVLGAQRAFFMHAQSGPYVGLLWSGYEALSKESRKEILALHREQGTSVRGE